MINDIVLIREGGLQSEQTFSITISVGNPGTAGVRPATLDFAAGEGDYRLIPAADFIVQEFPPSAQNITFIVFIFTDDLAEGTEGFRASSTPTENSPSFGAPSMDGAFATTEIRILDSDCKLACKCAASYCNVAVLSIVAVVGFVQPSYTVIENVTFAVVCVRVSNPPQDEDLVFNIDLIIQPRIGTAGKSFVY